MEYLDCAKKIPSTFPRGNQEKEGWGWDYNVHFLWAMQTLILKPHNLSCPADCPYFTSHYAKAVRSQRNNPYIKCLQLIITQNKRNKQELAENMDKLLDPKLLSKALFDVVRCSSSPRLWSRAVQAPSGDGSRRERLQIQNQSQMEPFPTGPHKPTLEKEMEEFSGRKTFRLFHSFYRRRYWGLWWHNETGCMCRSSLRDFELDHDFYFRLYLQFIA